MGSSVSDQPKRKAAQAPISAHPAFPAIVALWFAALLGLGSLVLPVALYERASEASGLSSLVAAAQPPLGVTARILVALAAGGLGVFAGLAIARRVIAASLRDQAPRRSAPARAAAQSEHSPAKRPISAHEELGEDGLDADDGEALLRDPLPGRRRALSVTDDSPRSEFLDHAPLSEADPEPLDLAGFDALAAVEYEHVADAPAPAQRAGPLRADPAPAAIAEGQTMTPAHPPARPTGPGAAGEPPAGIEQSLGGLAMVELVELVERFAHALQQHRESAQRAADSPDAADAAVDLTSALASRDAPDGGTADELDDEPGQSEEHYSSLLAMKSPFGLAREAVRIEDEAEREAAAIEPVVNFPGQPPRRAAPAADAGVRTPVSFSTPPLRPFDAPANRLVAAASAAPSAPSAPSADSAETEKRLRDALEKLQKMSGVG